MADLYTVRTFGRDCLGNITGYVVERGSGANREQAGTFIGNIYEHGSFQRAKQEAEQRAADLNNILVRDVLTRIVNRATRPRKAGSTEIMLCDVPAALLDEARALLKL